MLIKAGYYTGSEIPFWMVNHWATQIGSDERESARRRQFIDMRDFPNRWNNRKVRQCLSMLPTTRVASL